MLVPYERELVHWMRWSGITSNEEAKVVIHSHNYCWGISGYLLDAL